jgi:hypothetical protein
VVRCASTSRTDLLLGTSRADPDRKVFVTTAEGEREVPTTS